MYKIITQRIQELREIMKHIGVNAYFISGTDPHLSEYPPEYWNSRAFISGFTGSSGTVIISENEAALWTDSRYFIQAEAELQGTGIQLMKINMPETPSHSEWLKKILTSGSIAGTDAMCISASQFQILKNDLCTSDISLKDTRDLLESIWESRPPLPVSQVFVHDIQYEGKSRMEKISNVREKLKVLKADFAVVTALDDLAWLFNLRGNDVMFNPVFIGYAIIKHDSAVLYINPQKLHNNVKNELAKDGIIIKPYEDVFSDLPLMKGNACVDIKHTNQSLFGLLTEKTTASVVAEMKSVKSDLELQHIKETMKRDGVAMIDFLYWIDQNIGKREVTEYDLSLKIEYFRSLQYHFKGPSFDTIVGYNENGAIVHRRVTNDNAVSVSREGILLFDSGGQYLTGTTDITRTICLSSPTPQQKQDFTLILKGLIALTSVVFPQGTKGTNLDIMARQAMWQYGINYGHGTSHGIGYFLCVHEGPISIRQEYNEYPILPGMVLSNEPGIYRQGKYGMRTENMMVCVEKMKTDSGTFFGFETLTLCPIDKQLIDRNILTETEIDWINKYHQQCFDELSLLLDKDKVCFLEKLTSEI